MAKTVKKIKLDSKKSSKKTEVTAKKSVVKPKKTPKTVSKSLNPFSAIWRYVKGSWYEIRQVRWPNRKATWGMTLAVILFTLFFATIILLLDTFFQWLFKNVLFN